MATLINNQIQFSQAQQQAPYLVYDLRVRTHWDSGQLQMPVAYVTNQAQQTGGNPAALPQSARQPSANIQVFAPLGWKIITFHIVRAGAPPVAPDPTPTDPNNEILRLADTEDMAPQISPDGRTYLYGMTGTYIYSLIRPAYMKDTRKIGSKPTDISSGNVVTGAQFAPLV